MQKRVLVTGAGGGGSNNLIDSLRASSLDLLIYGSNLQATTLAKSNADRNTLLPVATEPGYTEALVDFVQREGIELVIPNNDREVARLSADRDRIPCRVFLPPDGTVDVCQDKLKMYERLSAAGIALAESVPLKTLDDVDAEFARLKGTQDRVWVRLRRGSGSRGATWVKTAEQAKAWISLWVDLRGYSPEAFMLCSFLPGRDYAFQSVWRNGRLMVAKMCERLTYFFGEIRLSGMSSTPQIARTVRDEATLDLIFRAIHGVCERPHGNFCLDLKGDARGVMNVTEFNIGRFCMITPIFDRTGRINTAEMYVRCAFDEPVEMGEPIDIEEDMYLIRDLDTLPTIVRGARLRELAGTSPVIDDAAARRAA